MDAIHPTEDHPLADAFHVEFRLDEQGRVVACRTAGLADFHLPELLVLPEEPYDLPPACSCGCLPAWAGGPHRDPDDDTADPGLAVTLDRYRERLPLDDAEAYAVHVTRAARMMSLLALDLLEEDTVDVLPRSAELFDLPVRFWVGDPELVRYRDPGGPVEQVLAPVHWVIDG